MTGKNAPAKRSTLAVSVSAETYEKFEEIAWQRKHRRNSDALREALTEWMEKHGTVDTGATTGVKQ